MKPSSRSPVSQARFPVSLGIQRSPGSVVHGSALLFLACTLALPPSTLAQNPPGNTAQTASSTRACAATPAKTNPKNKAKRKTTDSESAQLEIPAACLEVKSSAMEIQEYLQKVVREQRWTIGQTESSDDSFTFYRLLDKEELAQVAKTEILGGRIAWTEGKGFVAVRTSDAGDGFTRVKISARFQGRGQTSERFARPSDLWPLVSKGTLEGSLIAALESHFSSRR